MQSSLLTTIVCILCLAIWTNAAPPIAQTTSPPDRLLRPTLTNIRLPSPVTELGEMASFGVDGTRNVVYAEVILNQPLKTGDVEKTLRMANASALKKDPGELLSPVTAWKFKAPGSKAVFKIKRVLERRWTYPDTARVINAIYNYYQSTEHRPAYPRYYRIEFIVHDEDGIHLAFGKVRETHTPWAGLVDSNGNGTNATAAVPSEDEEDDDDDDWDDADLELQDFSAGGARFASSPPSQQTGNSTGGAGGAGTGGAGTGQAGQAGQPEQSGKVGQGGRGGDGGAGGQGGADGADSVT